MLNSGAAFSFASGSTWVFSIIAAAVVVFLIWFARRIRSLSWAVLFGLLLGGTLGNLTDRLLRAPGFGVGRVVDFIQIPVLQAIFNIADSAIVTSMALFVLLTLRGHRARRRAAVRPPAGLTVPERMLPVPDGLVGERVDAGVAKLLGLSRTRVAAIADAGGHRARLPARRQAPTGCPPAPCSRSAGRRTASTGRREAIEVPGMRVAYEDDDIVVVDKPAGVAAHPSPGWTGTTVVGGLAAAGVRVSTSGAAERAGVVHRLDAGTSGLMVVAKSEHAYTVLKRAFKERTVEKRLPRAGAGAPGPAPPARSTRRSGGTRRSSTGSRWSPTAEPRSRTTRRSRRSAPRRCSTCTSRRGARTRSGCTSRTCGIRSSATRCTARIRCSRARLGLTRQWLHAARLGFAHPATGEWVEFESALPDDLTIALERLAG